MRGTFAGALLASAIIHAGVLLAPAPWIGQGRKDEAAARQLSVKLKSLPDLQVAANQATTESRTDFLPTEGLRPESPPGLFADSSYYKHSEVDKAAWPIGGIPQLDMLVTDPRKEWRLRARLFIDEKGKVSRVDVADDPPATEALKTAVAATLRTMSFTPAMKDGVNVKSQKLMDLVIDGGQ